MLVDIDLKNPIKSKLISLLELPVGKVALIIKAPTAAYEGMYVVKSTQSSLCSMENRAVSFDSNRLDIIQFSYYDKILVEPLDKGATLMSMAMKTISMLK